MFTLKYNQQANQIQKSHILCLVGKSFFFFLMVERKIGVWIITTSQHSLPPPPDSSLSALLETGVFL